MKKIRTGDQVVVTAGRNKGQQGVVRQNHIADSRVVIEGVNIVKKHVSTRGGRARQAGIIEVEAPLQVSNVRLICPNCGQPTRVGIRAGDDGKNGRYCKTCDQDIPRPEE